MTGERETAEVRLVALGKPTAFPPESHDFGQFVYPLAGVIELAVGRSLLTAPPTFGIWLPPGVEHEARTRSDTQYIVVDVPKDLCVYILPREGVLSTTAVARAILDWAGQMGSASKAHDQRGRLIRVLVDELSLGSDLGTHVPLSDDRLLKPILAALQVNPGDRKSLVQWADHVASTERTLARKFRSELGLTFAEWRQKLRVSRALVMLANGATIQKIAHDLGYNSVSAFISMFKRTTSFTPHHFRGKSVG